MSFVEKNFAVVTYHLHEIVLLYGKFAKKHLQIRNKLHKTAKVFPLDYCTTCVMCVKGIACAGGQTDQDNSIQIKKFIS